MPSWRRLWLARPTSAGPRFLNGVPARVVQDRMWGRERGDVIGGGIDCDALLRELLDAVVKAARRDQPHASVAEFVPSEVGVSFQHGGQVRPGRHAVRTIAARTGRRRIVYHHFNIDFPAILIAA